MTRRPRKTIGAIGVTAFCVMVGTGCGGDGTSAGTGGNGTETGALGTGASPGAATGGSSSHSADRAGLVTTPLEACVYYLEGWCERAARCTLFGGFDDCMDTVAGRCPDMFFSEGTLRTVENLVSCGDAWRNHACGDVAPPACTIYGTLPLESACLHGSQCETGLCSSTFQDCGTCIERTPLGADCATNVCERGAVCVDGTCIDAATAAPLPTIGEACDTSLCDATAYCDRSGTGGDICEALPAVGLELGEACAASTGIPCVEGLLCQGGVEGTCQPAGRIFEVCDETTGLGCHRDAQCVNGTCTPIDNAGLYASVCPE